MVASSSFLARQTTSSRRVLGWCAPGLCWLHVSGRRPLGRRFGHRMKWPVLLMGSSVGMDPIPRARLELRLASCAAGILSAGRMQPSGTGRYRKCSLAFGGVVWSAPLETLLLLQGGRRNTTYAELAESGCACVYVFLSEYYGEQDCDLAGAQQGDPMRA